LIESPRHAVEVARQGAPRSELPIDIFDRATGMVLGKPSRFVKGFPSSVLGGMQVVEEDLEPA
jgi:hypothetical protein